MRNQIIAAVLLGIALFVVSGFGQNNGLLTRKITRSDKFEFGAGGTVSITGAPMGSIQVVGSSSSEIEINAAIEIHASTEAELTQLEAVTGFATDESILKTGIISVGTNNRGGDKKQWKKFPKNLTGLPYRIDYVIKVPKYTDLEIEGGKGALSISGVQGSLRINFLETDAHIDLIAGSLMATIASGTVVVNLGVKGWTARPAVIQVGKGDLTVRLPSNASAELDATVLRTGTIENSLPDLKQRDRKVAFTDKSIIAKAGSGGTEVKFTVGDGTLRLERLAGTN
jgi:hypothetical protein